MAALLEARRQSFNSLWPKQFHEIGLAGARKNRADQPAYHRSIHSTRSRRPSRLLEPTIRVRLRSWVALVSTID
jgi:hypothetical protein